jgi:hypothetical protein
MPIECRTIPVYFIQKYLPGIIRILADIELQTSIFVLHRVICLFIHGFDKGRFTIGLDFKVDGYDKHSMTSTSGSILIIEVNNHLIGKFQHIMLELPDQVIQDFNRYHGPTEGTAPQLSPAKILAPPRLTEAAPLNPDPATTIVSIAILAFLGLAVFLLIRLGSTSPQISDWGEYRNSLLPRIAFRSARMDSLKMCPMESGTGKRGEKQKSPFSSPLVIRGMDNGGG